jgi:cellulose synthase/poly-beta-1,6-N-acetylglucosamine synthase-like glycosyltransferase
MTIVVFWICIGLIAYTYGGFALLLAVRARLCPRPYRASDITPRVSLVIAAHNEAASIGGKLQNALSLDYPPQQFEVIVASDGSTDGTDVIVRRFADRGVRLLSLPRRGKAAALNAAVAASTGEVLVFSDANSMYDAGAIRALARPLADPQVGGVAGDQRYLPAADQLAADEGERCYWNYDRSLKRWQSAAGHVTSSTGAIYAIRRELFTTVPEGVCDDFAVSTAVIAQGYRLVFATDAIAYEPPAKSADAEFARKVRIITRGLRGVIDQRVLFNPFRYGFFSLQVLTHKLLRRLMAIPLLALLLLSPWLWTAGPLYRLAVAGQTAVYSCAVLGWLLKDTRLGRWKLFTLPLFFVLVNLASLFAVVNLVCGRRIVTWQTTRPAAAPTANRPRPVLAGSGKFVKERSMR